MRWAGLSLLLAGLLGLIAFGVRNWAAEHWHVVFDMIHQEERGSTHHTWGIEDARGNRPGLHAYRIGPGEYQARWMHENTWRVRQWHVGGGWVTHDWGRPVGIRDRIEPGSFELAVPVTQPDTLLVRLFGNERYVDIAGAGYRDTSGDGRIERRLVPLGILENETHPPLLLIAWTAGADAGRRGIQAIDLDRLEPAWFYPTGPNPYQWSFRFEDLDHDGDHEILFCLPTSMQGRSAGSTDDRHSWVVALEPDGQELWAHRLSGAYGSPAWAEAVTPVPETSYVAAVAKRFHSGDTGQFLAADTLFVVTADKGRPTAYRPLDRQPCGLARFSNSHLLLTHYDGTFETYAVGADGQLARTAADSFVVGAERLSASDLDGDGRCEIAVLGRGPDGVELLVVDQGLRLRGRKLLDTMSYGSARVSFLQVRPDTPPLLLVGAGPYTVTFAPRVVRGQTYRLASAFLALPGIWWPGGALLAGTAMAALSAARRLRDKWRQLLETWSRRQQTSPTPVRTRVLRVEFERHMHKMHHGSSCAITILKMAGGNLENAAEDERPQALYRSHLLANWEQLDWVGWMQIDEALSLARALGVAPDRCARIEESAEVIGREWPALLERAWDAGTVAAARKALSPALETLAADLEWFRLWTQHDLHQRATRELRATLRALEQNMATGDQPLVVEIAPEADRLWIRAVPGDVHFMVENLVANAYRALGDGPGLVTVRAFPLNAFLVVEVEDDGCGIAPEAHEQIFAHKRPRGDGHGTGLVVSRRMVRDLHGNLELLGSEVGKGTTFALFLPLVSAPPDPLELPAQESCTDPVMCSTGCPDQHHSGEAEETP